LLVETMAFHFSLETLLRFRRSVERQRELSLLQAVQQVVSSMKEIEVVDHSISVIQKNEHQNIGAVVRAAQLHFDGMRSSVLRERRRELEKVLMQRESLRAQCQKEFQAAHRNREAVEVLRGEQLNRYEREKTRRDQKQMDDLFLLRREYLQRR